MSDFEDGFRFFQHNAGDAFAAFHGADYGTGRATYVDSVDQEISALEESINAFFWRSYSCKTAKG